MSEKKSKAKEKETKAIVKVKDELITIPSKCHLTTNAITFDDNITEEEFKEASRFLIGMDKSNRDCSLKFWIGDWINFGKEKFGLKKYKKTLFWDAGYKVRTLDNLAYVANVIPHKSRHREKLTFGHYQVLAPIKDEKERELWLDIAQKWELSVGKLREIKSLIALKKNNCPDDRVDCNYVAAYAREAAIKFGRYLAELFDFKEKLSKKEFGEILDGVGVGRGVRFYARLLIKELNNLLEDTWSIYDPDEEVQCTVMQFFVSEDNQSINYISFQERRGEARKKAIQMSKLLEEIEGEDKAITPIPNSEVKEDEEVIVIDDSEEWIASLVDEDEKNNPNDVEKDKSDSNATDEEIQEMLDNL